MTMSVVISLLLWLMRKINGINPILIKSCSVKKLKTFKLYGLYTLACSKLNRIISEKALDMPLLAGESILISLLFEGMGWFDFSAEKRPEYRNTTVIIPARIRLILIYGS